jgi:hypothetical protein
VSARYRFGTRRRDALWAGEVWAAHAADRGVLPICNLCDQPVSFEQPWHESHVGAPKALQAPGERYRWRHSRIGIAHKACNERDNNKRVTPMVAKAKRQAARAAGRKGPGLGPHPMRAGRFSTVTKTMRHGVQPRLTSAQKHARMLERLRVGPTEEAQP